MAASMDRIADEMTALRTRVDAMARKPQLANSSIENGRFPVKNAAGATQMLVGVQTDGTTAANVVDGPTPPTPSGDPLNFTVVPLVGGFLAGWNGLWVDPQPGWKSPVVAPMDLDHVEVHVFGSAGDTGAWIGTRHAIIPNEGGRARISDLFGGASLWFRLVAVSQAGKYSAVSAACGPLVMIASADTGSVSLVDDRVTVTAGYATAVDARVTGNTNYLIALCNNLQTNIDAAQDRITFMNSYLQGEIDAINANLLTKANLATFVGATPHWH